MSENERVAVQLMRALEGGAWHGPSWRDILEGVGRSAALDRPVANAHSIAEIVLHATAWHDAVRRRLNGENVELSEAGDWPAPDLPDEASWSRVVDRLFESGRALGEAVRRFPLDRFDERRPGLEGPDDTWFGLIAGELQHVLYHAGQVALLRKALLG